ncbi:MAG: hypothetical protein ACOYYS_11580 [Chloroflexota bacterium]
MDTFRQFFHPPSAFGVIPFWFWNDDLDEGELLRQIGDFQEHGAAGFVIHPRVGLPRRLGWMSEDLLRFYRIAIEEAQRRQMTVLLYDEGMYPSGSSCGQVVAENADFACRCLAKIDLPDAAPPAVSAGENLVAVVRRSNGSHLAIFDRPANSVIRGLHYIDEGPREDEPPAADILNPEAVATFIRLVYDKFSAHFQAHFGKTILAIFTDEPGLLGRSRERDVFPGTTGILAHVNRILGYDFTPHLAALWYDDEPDAAHYRREYERAIHLRLEETYYQQLTAWCEAHGIALTGHPHKGDDLGPLRYFHIPGQDLVWRWVLPDHPSALEGPESTQAKCASSAMRHRGLRRNANECCGAYGHELTWEEMNWLAKWAFVRGLNLVIPHAFYYSVRGIRRDERPPDVGPHSPWWDRFPEYALACRRLSWLNTDSQHVCSLAILGEHDWLPWRSAKVCYQYQYDFNYLEERDVLDQATVDENGIQIAGMTYRALLVEQEPSPKAMAVLAPMLENGRVYRYRPETPDVVLVSWLRTCLPDEVQVMLPTPALRVRHVVKEGRHGYLLFNEERAPLHFTLKLPIGIEAWQLCDPYTGRVENIAASERIHLEGYALKVLCGNTACHTAS